MPTAGAVSTARSTILVTISSNLPLPGRFAVALRDRFSYHWPWAALFGLGAAALTANFSKNLILPVAAAVLSTWLALQIP